ncbi:MAG: iron-containing alcohol dehydrogenase [Polyangiaceae bacterium]|nr:iron-containing alcohol dehydrogenase [Polyangiaceae bacterium]
MLCCRFAPPEAGFEGAFTVDASRVTFGRGCLAEVGDRAAAYGIKRVALFTDRRIVGLDHYRRVERSLRAAGLDVVTFADVHVEPTDASFQEAARFAKEARPDGYVSIGGGSVIDTCKAANLYATHPAPFEAYVNAPVGEGRAVPGGLAPHIACPTTSGTGSEVTGIAIFDWVAHKAKTGIASIHLRPTEALVDPDVTATLPRTVVAASGMDVLCHALESFTARPFTVRPSPARPTARPMSQGRNPWSDIGCREALSLLGRYLVRAVEDDRDMEAREAVMWAATLAGIAFGNAGVHVPHAMSYAVAGLAEEVGYHAPDYPRDEPLVPHGISVVVNAPAVFRKTGPSSPDRHIEAARLLGVRERTIPDDGAGETLADRLVELLRVLGLPNGVGGIGFSAAQVPALAAGTSLQTRLLTNAPIPTPPDLVEELFRGALTYW